MVKGEIIDLTDGTRIEAKINFGTLYYLEKCNAVRLAEKIKKKQDDGKEPTDGEKMDFAAKVIYAVLRSNGKQVTFDEALQLMPPDPDDIQTIIDGYQEELNRIKKKKDAKMNMKRTFQQK